MRVGPLLNHFTDDLLLPLDLILIKLRFTPVDLSGIPVEIENQVRLGQQSLQHT